MGRFPPYETTETPAWAEVSRWRRRETTAPVRSPASWTKYRARQMTCALVLSLGREQGWRRRESNPGPKMLRF